ncbi:MAG: P13 family porin [Deltaproteobacteria bacterium]|nr:MAG: P13 family porin [Deltaproteobacteria bacterium]
MKTFLMCWIGILSVTFGINDALAKTNPPTSASTSLQNTDKHTPKLPTLIDTTLSLGATSSPGKTSNPIVQGVLLCDNAMECRGGSGPVSRILGLVVNIFLPFAIGSWLVGDYTGGTIGLVGQVGGVALMLMGQFLLQGFLSPVGALVWIIGITLATVGYIVPMFTVLFGRHRRRYSRNDKVYEPPRDTFAQAFPTATMPVVKGSF